MTILIVFSLVVEELVLIFCINFNIFSTARELHDNNASDDHIENLLRARFPLPKAVNTSKPIGMVS